jgi:hypothetical protein
MNLFGKTVVYQSGQPISNTDAVFIRKCVPQLIETAIRELCISIQTLNLKKNDAVLTALSPETKCGRVGTIVIVLDNGTKIEILPDGVPISIDCINFDSQFFDIDTFKLV